MSIIYDAAELQNHNSHDYDNDDFSGKYKINIKYIHKEYQHCVTPLQFDSETQTFLDNCEAHPRTCKSIIANLIKPFLCCLPCNIADINVMLGRGEMFVLSSAQFKILMQGITNAKFGSLVDFGSGDGNVLQKYSSFFDQVTCVEKSETMCNKLKLKFDQYTIIRADRQNINNNVPDLDGQKFDCVACFNLLDVCDNPFALMKDMIKLIKQKGIIIIAIVLPFRRKNIESERESQYLIQDNQDGFQRLQDCDSFEESVNILIQYIFEPLDLTLLKISRVPYLCQGNFFMPYLSLNDSIFILQQSKKYRK